MGQSPWGCKESDVRKTEHAHPVMTEQGMKLDPFKGTERAFDKIPNPCCMKILNRLGIERKFLILIKGPSDGLI